MLETILITAAVAFGAGWFARNHVGNIATAAVACNWSRYRHSHRQCRCRQCRERRPVTKP